VTDRTLTVTCHTHPTGATVLSVTGELDYHTAPQLTHAIQDAPFAADRPVVMDLTGLTYCDSTGITVLIHAYQRAQTVGCPLSVAGLNEDLLRVFRIVGLDQVFSFHPTVDTALNAPQL
jgi:anti-sigma B factor antagonist